jgi:phosphatidylserine/phosphatidylglycerophosphate/cardiolipin synthase-like enzyme
VALVDAHHYYRTVHRAIAQAERYVLLSGWQFDTNVQLLRGQDADGAQAPVELLPLLEWLCEERADLQIYILAWDYNLVFALEREWFQGRRFGTNTCERIQFRWDGFVPDGGAHHQKLVVVDGLLAFSGGMDLCESRWDRRDHAARDPLRHNANGRACKPYHDVQTCVAGAVVKQLEEIFCARWTSNGGAPITLMHSERPAPSLLELTAGDGLALGVPQVAVSQTRVTPSEEPDPPLRHIRQLYLDAIASADKLIYIENQYFTSRAVLRAMVERLEDAARPKLQIVILMPRGGDSPKEKFALATAQNFVLGAIRNAAQDHGHSFRAFFSGSRDEAGEVVPTFIHAKLLIVDDRLLTIGSANLTNRSFGLDSELNLTWATESNAVHDDIAHLRASLLAEHSGTTDPQSWVAIDGLTERLDAAERADTRLHQLDIAESDSQDPLLSLITDPVSPVDSAELDRRLDEAWESLDVGWLRELDTWLAGKAKADVKSDDETPAAQK